MPELRETPRHLAIAVKANILLDRQGLADLREPNPHGVRRKFLQQPSVRLVSVTIIFWLRSCKPDAVFRREARGGEWMQRRFRLLRGDGPRRPALWGEDGTGVWG